MKHLDDALAAQVARAAGLPGMVRLAEAARDAEATTAALLARENNRVLRALGMLPDERR